MTLEVMVFLGVLILLFFLFCLDRVVEKAGDNPERIHFRATLENLPDGSPLLVVEVFGIYGDFYSRAFKSLEGGVRYSVLDCENLHFVGSEGIGWVVKAADECMEQGGLFAMVKVPPEILSVMDMLGLRPFIPVYDTKEQAIESFMKHHKR